MQVGALLEVGKGTMGEARITDLLALGSREPPGEGLLTLSNDSAAVILVMHPSNSIHGLLQVKNTGDGQWQRRGVSSCTKYFTMSRLEGKASPCIHHL